MPYNPNYVISLELYLIRHGHSMANGGNAGPSIEEKEDPTLSELGTKQARLLGDRFSSYPLDCIIASGLKRTIETAIPVADMQPENGAKTVELHPIFAEVGLSKDYSGKTFDEIETLYPGVIPSPGTENYVRFISHTESGESSKERAKEAIKYLTERFHYGEKVMVISHGGFNRYLLEAAMNIDFIAAESDPTFFNTGVTKINFYKHGEGIYGNDVNLVYMNDHSHLMKEMPMLSFTKA